MHKTKMVVVMRSDLGLRKGEIAVQASHAFMRWLTERIKAWRWEDWGAGSGDGGVMTEEEDDWVLGTFTKIVVKVYTKDELLSIQGEANAAGLTCWPV
jgi:peptidyl-tRNA hydrolase